MNQQEHQPFVPSHVTMQELTPVPVIVGVILGIIFGASSLYLALKVGMTVSASIPIAVLSITLFKAFSKVFGLRKATILENNIVQTTGSAGESIAFGVAVTMPALLIMGHDMELSRILSVSVLGGLLGVLMMIPLRYSLIVQEHGKLPYPEGTACADVLIVGEKGGTSAKVVFTGFFIGLVYKFLNAGMKLWQEVPTKVISWFKGASLSAEVSPELLGVGFIIGPRIACVTVAGGILATWVLTPMIKLFGDGLPMAIFPATKPILEMSLREIWRSYVLYIGAGAVAAAGIISMVRSLPMIVRGATGGLSSLRSAKHKGRQNDRTSRDLPMSVVLVGCLLLVLMISFTPSLHMNVFGAILIVLFGFLFVTVSARLTGEIGSSSNPISGMTVATLLLTSLIFLSLGWVSLEYRITALSVAAIVCIAASNGGTIAQDLKTGFLVGGTPRSMQIAILIGALTSAVVIGYTLNLLNDASTVYSKKAVPADVRVPDVASLTKMETLHGPGAEADPAVYHVLQLAETPQTGPLSALMPGKYLVDDSGLVRYFVDPGINGQLSHRDDGSFVQKYDAPKARLMSLIIDGILSQKLPWGLVLLGAMIVVVLELCGVHALPFAVGVYLPLSTSAAIFSGGFVRWMVDKVRARVTGHDDPESEFSPGILLSSGLIAGGAIAGILLALCAQRPDVLLAIDMEHVFPAFTSNNWTAVIAFAVMAAVLFKIGLKKDVK